LERVDTDFVVFINVPHAQGEYDPSQVNVAEKKWGPLVERAGLVKQEIQKTLKIVDWGLFGQEAAANEDQTMGG
jgi:hypothetical protein